MRPAAISFLAIIACFPAFADARLPIVNVGAASVSARAAFGEPITAAPAKKVIARTATKSAPIDSGEKIAINSNDILTPNRPSSNLWARMDAPLRMPTSDEIKIVRSDFDLPEENLDAPAPKLAMTESAPAPVNTKTMDAEIARLVELQRRADESVRAVSARPSQISSYDAPRIARTAERVTPAVASVSESTTDVSLRRVVVPMNDDVVVRAVAKPAAEPKFASMDSDMSKMSPSELKKAFKKTYLSENKHLSAYKIDDRFDVASEPATSIEGFTAVSDLSESGGVRPLEIKIGFRGDDSALSRDNYNLLSEYASIVTNNPKRAIQISIPERATRSLDDRKLAARRLAIVEQVLRDTGVSEARIMPVLASRNDDSFVLRVISSDQYETMTQKKRDMFGDNISSKTYRSMSW